MRKIGYYAIAAFIAITGCTKEEFSGNGSIKGNYTLKVEIENGSDTRTAVDNENRVIWVKNDQIGVWGNKRTVNACFKYNEMSDDGSIASFNGTLEDDEQPIAAYYPYRMEASLIDDKLSFTLPSEYEYTECSNAPMIGVKQENGNFLFKHLCGLMKLTLKGVPVGSSKLIISSEGENAKGISGQAIVTDIKRENAILTISEEGLNTVAVNVDAKEVSDKTFYIPLPVGKYSQISVSYSMGDNVYFQKTISDCQIKRGVILIMPEVPVLNEGEMLEEYLQTIRNYISTLMEDSQNDVELVKDGLISWLKQQSYVSDIEYDDSKDYVTITYSNGLQSMVSFDYVEDSTAVADTKTVTEEVSYESTIYDVAYVGGETLAVSGPVLYLQGTEWGWYGDDLDDEFEDICEIIEKSPINAKMEKSYKDIFVLNRLEKYSTILISSAHGAGNIQGGFGIQCDDIQQDSIDRYGNSVLPNLDCVIFRNTIGGGIITRYKFLDSYFIKPEYFDNYQWPSTYFIYGNYCWSYELGKHITPSFCGYKCKTSVTNNVQMSKEYFGYLFNGVTHGDAVGNVEKREYGYFGLGHMCELVSSDKHKKQRYFSITTNPVKHLDGVFGGVKVTGKFNGYNNLKKQGIQYGVFYRKKDNSEFIPSDPAVEFATFGESFYPKPLDQEGNLTLAIYNLDPETDYQFTLGFKYGAKYYYGNVCEFTTGAEMDREALIDYYYQADGDNWDADAKTNWCTDKPISEWANVTTSILDGNMRVTRLVFPKFSEKVENINLQRLDSLTTVDINGAQLKNLNVSGLVRLKCIEDCLGNNSIDYVNLSNCRNYTHRSDWGLPFNYGKNTNLSGCISLSGTFAIYDHMEILDLSGCTALEYISGPANNLKELDASGCSRVKEIDINQSSNRKLLNRILLNGCLELQILYCNLCELSILDVSSCNKLERLYCDNNRLTSLKLGELPLLYELYCAGNQLASLDLNQCKSLQTLSCGWNQLTILNVSVLNKLSSLYCDNNQLTSIEIPSNYSLGTLSCKDNKITTLDVSKMFSDQSSVEAQDNYITLVKFRNRMHEIKNKNNFTLWGEYSASNKYYSSIDPHYEYPQHQYAE